MAKYIRIWEGIIEHGRDMGYPETKTRLYDGTISLVQDEDKQGIIYKLVPLNGEDLEHIEETKKVLNDQEKRRKLRAIEEQMEKLKKEMEKYEED